MRKRTKIGLYGNNVCHYPQREKSLDTSRRNGIGFATCAVASFQMIGGRYTKLRDCEIRDPVSWAFSFYVDRVSSSSFGVSSTLSRSNVLTNSSVFTFILYVSIYPTKTLSTVSTSMNHGHFCDLERKTWKYCICRALENFHIACH